jgi:protein TonB
MEGIGFGCDDEAMRVVSEMPTWRPGIQNGTQVPVRLILPINFTQE